MKAALPFLKQALKERGFSARGTTFYRKEQGGNTLVCSIQKSTKSSPAEARVTFNYGVYSARIGRALQDDSSWAHDISRSHWRERLSDGGREKWILVPAGESPDEAASALRRAFEEILPDLDAHATDESLRQEWFRGSSPGQGAMQRLLYLAILLNEIGPRESLASVLTELRDLVSDGAHAGLVRGQLARAGVQMDQ